MERKYELTNEIMEIEGKQLYRIKALKDFSDVKKDDMGGWIEKESNLSHEGDCWIYNEAKVYDNAEVYSNARIYEDSKIFGYARVFDNCWICGNVDVYDNARIYGNARVFNHAKVYENARVYGSSKVFEYARIYGTTEVYNKAKIHGDIDIKDVEIIGEVQIPFQKIEFFKNQQSRLVTAILTLDGEWKFNAGCKTLMSKEEFIYRIHNYEGGLEENPHREFYLRMLNLY